MACLGGCAKAAYVFVVLREKEELVLKPRVIAAHQFIALFAGFMCALLAHKLDPQWALLAAGMGGYLGSQGLDWIASILHAKFAAAAIRPPGTAYDPNSWKSSKPKG